MMIEKDQTASGDATALRDDRDEAVPQPAHLSPAAQRALAEAAERRAADELAQASRNDAPNEVGGRKGPEPTRYGDWEKGGIVSDF